MSATAGLGPKDVARRYGVGEKWVRELARQADAGHRAHQRWLWRGWDDPDLQPILRRLKDGRAEGEEVSEWDLTLSGKNQVTLPVAALKALRVKAGDKLTAVVKGRVLELLPHPLSWADYYAGIAAGLYGQTDEEIDAYIRESRGEWEPVDE